MKLIYYAPDYTMGDTSPENCDAYRAWALNEIKIKYPNANVCVDYSDGDNFARGFDTEKNPNGNVSVLEFLNELWDKCPWDWI